MPFDAEIAAELVLLRKGRGLTDAHLAERVGPALRSVGRIPADLAAGHVRQLVAGVLSTAVRELPPDLGRAADAMFGMSAGYRRPTLMARQQLLADQAGCTVRTARRRCDEALRLLAEYLSVNDPAPAAPSPQRSRADTAFSAGTWFTEVFRALVRLDLERPEIREERRVVASTPGLAIVTASTGLLTLADKSRSPGAAVLSEIDYGGTMIASEGLPAGVALATVRLPRPLAVGEPHWYGRTVRLPPHRPVVPRITFSPVLRCDCFALRVRFAARRLPTSAWLYSGTVGDVVAGDEPTSERVVPDEAGEIAVEFTELLPDRTYGLGWEH